MKEAIRFEALAVYDTDTQKWSSRALEYHNGQLCAEAWRGQFSTEDEALSVAREYIADLWLYMATHPE